MRIIRQPPLPPEVESCDLRIPSGASVCLPPDVLKAGRAASVSGGCSKLLTDWSLPGTHLRMSRRSQIAQLVGRGGRLRRLCAEAYPRAPEVFARASVLPPEVSGGSKSASGGVAGASSEVVFKPGLTRSMFIRSSEWLGGAAASGCHQISKQYTCLFPRQPPLLGVSRLRSLRWFRIADPEPRLIQLRDCG
jgi:hypothetical protein